MSTATLLFCAAWLRGAHPRCRATQTDPPGFNPLTGRVRKARWAICAGPAAALASALASAADAQDAGPQRQVIGTAADTRACVAVEDPEQRATHLDCAARRLQRAARAAQTQARAALDTPVTGAGSSDIHTGVASQSATRQRLGSSFGTSVRPQRPRPPVWSGPMRPRR